MALITCQKCGKQISDTAKACIHCGFSLVREEKKETAAREIIDYNKLSLDDKNVLRTEFLKKNPAYEVCEKKRERFLMFINVSFCSGVISLFLFVCLWGGGFIYHQVTKEDTPVFILIIMLVLFVSAIISSIANILQRKVFYKKHRHNELIINKNMRKWLKEEKNVSYTLLFSPKQRKDKDFFESIDILKDDIER